MVSENEITIRRILKSEIVTLTHERDEARARAAEMEKRYDEVTLQLGKVIEELNKVESQRDELDDTLKERWMGV